MRDFEYENKLRESIFKLIEKPDSDPSQLSKDEREFLYKGANYFLKQKKPYVPRLVFTFLQDFKGLRKIIKKMGFENNIDVCLSFLELKDYEGLRRLLNKHPETADNAFYTITNQFKKHMFSYVEKHGFLNPNACTVFYTNFHKQVSAISKLCKEYDVVVPIARGGLFSGAIADLLGLPSKIVEIHAHGKKIPSLTWKDSIEKKDFEKKRVLLFDKDVVDGKTLKLAVEALKCFNPAKISVFFNYGPNMLKLENIPEGIREVYHPENVSPSKVGNLFLNLHERLGTREGRRLKIMRELNSMVSKLKKIKKENAKKDVNKVAETLENSLKAHLKLYNSLNPFLPGTEEVKEKIVSRLEFLHNSLNSLLGLSTLGLSKEFKPIKSMQEIQRFLNTFKVSFSDYAHVIARARYVPLGLKCAEERGVKLEVAPHDFLASFRTAFEAVKHGYDYALIVGPEGFAYEPFFRDLGLKTLAVNIPEAEWGGKRSFKAFDDLSVLEGKRVLVVEDDVRSGATLQKLIEELNKVKPAFLGLYLGALPSFQKMENVPSNFKKIHALEKLGKLEEPGKPSKNASLFLKHLQKKGIQPLTTKTTKKQLK